MKNLVQKLETYRYRKLLRRFYKRVDAISISYQWLLRKSDLSDATRFDLEKLSDALRFELESYIQLFDYPGHKLN